MGATLIISKTTMSEHVLTDKELDELLSEPTDLVSPIQDNIDIDKYHDVLRTFSKDFVQIVTQPDKKESSRGVTVPDAISNVVVLITDKAIQFDENPLKLRRGNKFLVQEITYVRPGLYRLNRALNLSNKTLRKNLQLHPKFFAVIGTDVMFNCRSEIVRYTPFDDRNLFNVFRPYKLDGKDLEIKL